jgi:hypothetical protein
VVFRDEPSSPRTACGKRFLPGLGYSVEGSKVCEGSGGRTFRSDISRKALVLRLKPLRDCSSGGHDFSRAERAGYFVGFSP